MSEMETRVLKEILRHLEKGNIGSASWQAQKLQSRGRINSRIRKIIEEGTTESIAAVESMLAAEAVKNANNVDSMVRGSGWSGALPENADEALKASVAAWDKVAAGAINQTGANLLKAANQAYIDIVDKTVAGVLAGEMTGREAIQEASRQFGKSGLPAIRDRAGREWSVEAYTQTVVRSNVRNVTTQVQQDRTKQWGLDLVEVDSHAGARPGCAPYQGKVYSLSGDTEGYPNINETSMGELDGLFGINCLIGETLVSGPCKRALYRRKYTGELVTINTASGKKLTVTPNHPILTSNGWVPAGLLKKGGNVISSTRKDWIRSVGPNPYNNITPIEEIFNSFSHRFNMFGLATSPGDFHGDSTNSEVDVILVNGFLWNWIKATLDKHIKKGFFHNAIKPFFRRFFAFCPFDKIFNSAFRAFNGFMRFISNRLAPIFAASFMHLSSSVRFINCFINAKLRKISAHGSLGYPNSPGNFIFPHSAIVHIKEIFRAKSSFFKKVFFPRSFASVDAVSLEQVINSFFRASSTGSYRINRLAGSVTVDNVISVKRESPKGSFVHVYNLENKNNWYYANGIVTHNCGHNQYPYFPGSKKTYQPYGKRENEQTYKESQRQRAIERNIRRFKRELELAQETGDTKTADRAKKGISRNQAIMREFINKTDRTRRYDREQIY